MQGTSARPLCVFGYTSFNNNDKFSKACVVIFWKYACLAVTWFVSYILFKTAEIAIDVFIGSSKTNGFKPIESGLLGSIKLYFM